MPNGPPATPVRVDRKVLPNIFYLARDCLLWVGTSALSVLQSVQRNPPPSRHGAPNHHHLSDDVASYQDFSVVELFSLVDSSCTLVKCLSCMTCSSPRSMYDTDLRLRRRHSTASPLSFVRPSANCCPVGATGFPQLTNDRTSSCSLSRTREVPPA